MRLAMTRSSLALLMGFAAHSAFAGYYTCGTTIYTNDPGTCSDGIIPMYNSGSLPTPSTASVVSRTFQDNLETITYSDGSQVVKNAIRKVVAWGSDHVTKKVAYVFADGRVNRVVSTVQPTLYGENYTPANYTANWTSGGPVIKPKISPLILLYGDGYGRAIENGTAALPFTQTTLTALGITDPNNIVKTDAGATYNLRWGTPDRQGPYYASLFNQGNSDWTLPNRIKVMGHWMSGQCSTGSTTGYCSNGPTLAAPYSDVIDAWNAGWTGKGVNVLITDSYSSQPISPNTANDDAHGITTMMLANRYALGATYFGIDIGTAAQGPAQGAIRTFNGSPAKPLAPVNLGVINASWGANYWSIGHAAPFTAAEIASVNAGIANYTNWGVQFFSGSIVYPGFRTTDAVITKSAGNDSISADIEAVNSALAAVPSIRSRLLIVGALNYAGSVSNPATLASYSNYAGTNPNIQGRFLVASGNTPYNTGAVAVDGQPLTAIDNMGTSYAAPRVAGYAAILRQKFPNLTGASSANVLLQTARYDTLSCYATPQGCDKSIYGQGEASLSRALAPVGLLH